LNHLDEVLTRLSASGLNINASKSFFARTQLEYLGYWITGDGVKPLNKKVEAINNLAPPKSRTEVRKFIVFVMWKERSEILAPLTELTSTKKPWKWTNEQQNAFNTMKKIMVRETILAYPNFEIPFEIHTDASAYQHGACISQKGKPNAFYSRKLTPAQTRYTTTKKELLHYNLTYR
jgi:hypothetical protein